MRTKRKTNRNYVKTTVPCPAWLQKKMLRNLRISEKNKVNRVRAAKASNILKETGYKN